MLESTLTETTEMLTAKTSKSSCAGVGVGPARQGIIDVAVEHASRKESLAA